MFRRLTSLFIFFCCLYRYSLCDCFYIFDVGQGNCQLAVFEDEKIGIMYDCGSSSAKEHVKISALKHRSNRPTFPPPRGTSRGWRSRTRGRT